MIRFAVPLLASLLASGTALAQHHHHATPPTSSSHANEPTATDGVVQKIDKDAGKITLKHGEIKNIGMPPMTMTFPVKERALLDTLTPGAKVTFFVQQTGSGAMMVTAIEKAN
ncbi:MAG: copper-binding protein [Betaproteobacteria bacterium]|nr:copper-binding protein [Betaproteobacteria bacterium]